MKKWVGTFFLSLALYTVLYTSLKFLFIFLLVWAFFSALLTTLFRGIFALIPALIYLGGFLYGLKGFAETFTEFSAEHFLFVLMCVSAVVNAFSLIVEGNV